MVHRKIICWILAAGLIFSLLPIPAMAEETTEYPLEESMETTGQAPTVLTEEEEPTDAPEDETVQWEPPQETEESAARFAQSSSMCFETEKEPRLFAQVPKLYQDDYPDTPFGNGTVATSGCTITCLAMAASYLQGWEYDPGQLARQYQGAGENNIERMEAAAEDLALSYQKAYEWETVMDALGQERIVMILLRESSLFTDDEHTILLTELTPQGTILVNDPNRHNGERKELQPYFESGFPEEVVREGFAGCWIFEDTETARQARAAREKPAAKAKSVTLTSVPLYLQTDYADVPYNDGTIATSGCALTCAAMVASYLRQEDIRPDELVRRFGTYESSNVQRMEAASIVLDLPYEKTLSWWDVRQALKEGKIAIVMLEKASPFTDTQHMVVAAGITEDGKILVKDPNGMSYKNAALKEGFATGFPDEMLQQGFSGAWIYDSYTPPEDRESRYPDFSLTDEDLHLIASTIYLEARGEPFEGQQAIAEIIFNRLASGKFSETVRGTILAQGQFRTAKFLDKAKPGELQYKAIEMALTGPNVLPETVYFFGRSPANKNVWGRVGNHVFCGSY